MKKQQEEKLLAALRQLATLPENKKCFDCRAKGPTYAVVDLGTFVCTTCSGIHREFNHRVKSISMATFKPEEVESLKRMGNQNAAKIWLAKWTPADFQEPEPHQVSSIREFMQLKYVAKKWYSPNGVPSAAPQVSVIPPVQPSPQSYVPKQEPLSVLLGNNIPPINVAPTYQPTPTIAQPPPVAQPTTAFDLLGGGSGFQPAPTQPVQPSVADLLAQQQTAEQAARQRAEEESRKKNAIMASFQTLTPSAAPGLAAMPGTGMPAPPAPNYNINQPANYMMMPGGGVAGGGMVPGVPQGGMMYMVPTVGGGYMMVGGNPGAMMMPGGAMMMPGGGNMMMPGGGNMMMPGGGNMMMPGGNPMMPGGGNAMMPGGNMNMAGMGGMGGVPPVTNAAPAPTPVAPPKPDLFSNLVSLPGKTTAAPRNATPMGSMGSNSLI